MKVLTAPGRNALHSNLVAFQLLLYNKTIMVKEPIRVDRSTKVQYWLLQLGKLYYAGGLARKSPIVDRESFSYEFVNDESLAFPFLDSSFAENAAAKSGGKIISRETTMEGLATLRERHYAYIGSENEWHKEQELAIIEELAKQND